MTNNRYAPPVAIVGEVAEQPGAPRPAPVLWAVRLLWATTLLAIPEFYAEAMRAPSAAHMIVGLVFEAALTAFGCYLYVCIYRGRNWARILTLILTVLSTAMVVFVPGVPDRSNLEQLFTVVNTVSDVACMALLFMPSASAWFRGRAR